MAQRFPPVDLKVYELAEYFHPDGTPDQLSHFAGCIQEEIENWLEEHSHA